MRALLRLVVLTALRDRLFTGLAGLGAFSISTSFFLGAGALIEQSETATVYGAGALRVVVVLGLVVFVAFQTQRLYESREIEAILSRSVSRSSFVIGYWAGFALVAVALVLPLSSLLFYLQGFSSAALEWSLSLWLECLVILAFTMFAALTFERAMTTIFVSCAFYSLTRLMGFFLGIRDATPDIGANRLLNPMLDVLALLVPRLDLMTQTRWLVYGFDSAALVVPVLTQATVFAGAALAATSYDMARKEF